MEDRFGKYLRLFGTVFFSVLGILLFLLLLMLCMRLLFGLLAYVPWSVYIYMAFIIMVPATLFITAYVIYFFRTGNHPVKAVRWVSYGLFTVAVTAWAVFLVMDMVVFFKHAYAEIGKYRSYDMLFLAANVVCFFGVGVMQALTTAKEKDWMERRL